MAKDTKKKKAEKKARTALKTAKKAHQKTKKQRRASISSTESEDIDTILASFQTTTTTTPTPREVKCPPPRARSATTLLPSPTSKELILFGGEFFSGERASFSNELFIYKVASRQWRRVEGDGPLPRSGHAVALLPSKGEYYLFGGEFSSSRQKAFYHYGDLWRLTARGGWAWERIGNSTAKGGAGPSARSGHRMVAYKQFVFLFGGFQDTANETKYLDDTWVFDTSTEKWWSVATQGLKPAARSSFSFLPHPEGAVLVGGYSRVKETLRGGRTTTRPLVHV
ncbi:galactose oxidase, partial [Piedraia hortae CBS 480.64]